ncbi:hypothetical protein EVJ58_g1265 [Rhodofomes roseus]|uniref:Polyketide synthase-like phosphopantetheine-binding domain-containing protein n=1 Tax=Rhodofomes roseus TaxID=34475 RepID=A0A4Y9YZM2_9APHY|nr:hypothetical protein EVJ58_g1265 [Rhodofomes roseus]
MGFQMICWAASCGMVLSAFEPGVPIALATPEGHFEAARASGSDIICSLPAVLEAWSRNQEAVNWLAGRDGALYSGGPLNPHVGEYLRSQGVDIAVVYGSTEVGALTPIVPEKGNHDWDYFELSSFLHTRMVPSGDNAYEIVVIANEFCHPCVINTQVDGHDAYATSDLLVPHSTTPGLWKVYGRTDEQIIHSTGEKTNPGPLESILNQDPHIASCVMFGRGQFQAGVLVDPVLDHRPLPLDERQLAEFRDKIWPTVTQMNAFAPQHSRLFKEMIMVTDLAKPFTYTAKGTPRRQPVLRDYSQEIERLYEIVHDSTQSDIPAPLTWDLLSTTDFVRRVVGRVLVHAVGDTDDFFQNGCDSLQATWIRNSILRGLRDSAKLETREITRDFVYEHPTVVALSVYVSGLAAGSTNDTDTSEQARVAAMRAMARAYSEAFPRHQPGTGRSHHDTHADKSVFLLTGTTGSFGCHILHRLVSDPHVSRVFALNRPSKDGISLRERQNAALIERGLPTDVLGDKAILLEVDLAAQQFGTSGTLYEEMRNSVTHIVHNAWRVDFNVSLTSFESNIKGLRGLVDFALSSGMHQPPRLTFMSSIGVLRDSSHEEGHIEPEVAAGSGYSESKWVAEEMLYRARKETSLQTLSVRVGQLCGGIDGSWNSNEWFPALVQSAEILRCFPRDDRTVDWIPLDVAATAVAEFCTTTSPVGFLHLVHPRPVPWDSIAAVVAAELRVGLIAFDVWLAKLEQKGNTATTHPGCDEVEMLRTLPALRLLPFFKTIIKPGAIGSQDLAMTNAMGASPSLSDPNVRQVGEDDVRKWIAYWRRVGLLSNSGR